MKKLFFYTCLLLISISAIAQVPSHVPTNGLLAYYPFNGNANDASGNGYNGFVTGALLTKGVGNNLNGAYKFKNNNDIIVTNLSNSNLQSLTISSWFKYKNPISFPLPTLLDSTWHSICGFSDNNNNVSDLIAASDYGASSNSSNIRLSGYTYNGNRNWVNTNANQLDTNWHHIVYVRGVYSLLIYLDGVLQNTNAYNGSYQYLTNFVIGRYYKIWNQVAFKGSIDDVGIWNRALTQSEITALYITPIAAASDSLWVINKQTDTLAFPSQVKLSLKSNNITSKNISADDIKLNYDASKLKFDSVTKTNTASANGSVIVNSSTAGQVIIGWASSSSISSATLPLLNCFFTPIDSGKTTVSISNAIFNTDTVKNRYSKSVINKFNFGDVDMNKIIQSYDASLVLKYSVGIDPLPTIDPLPWEPWRIKIASVDTTIAVNANDASLILKYSVGIITKFPKRGIVSAPGYVTVNLENNELVVRSFEDMGGLNITFLDHLSDLGAPTYVHNTNALSAFNKQANMYKIGVAFSEAPVNGTVILRIPYTGLGNQTLNMELVENTAARNYQLNVVTGINDIKNANIKIYPNPTNNIINIEGLTKNENNTIQIFDVQGKLVITKTITEKGTIDLSELNKGVYVIKIGELAQRIVKM